MGDRKVRSANLPARSEEQAVALGARGSFHRNVRPGAGPGQEPRIQTACPGDANNTQSLAAGAASQAMIDGEDGGAPTAAPAVHSVEQRQGIGAAGNGKRNMRSAGERREKGIEFVVG
jgi:hypothetical protein